MSSTNNASMKERWGNFLFITPYLLVFIFMIALPLFWGIYLSFQKVDLFGPGKFIGWNNYIRLFDNKIFLQTVWNTCYFVLLTVPALVVIGLGLAMALNQQTRTANILRIF